MIIGEYCDVFPPEIDGVGTVVKNYVTHMNDGQNNCLYIAPKPKESLETDEIPALNYASVPLPKEAYRLGLPFIDVNYLWNVSKISFDLVHAHSPFTAGTEAIRMAQFRHIPLVGSFHSKYYDDFYSKTKSKVISKQGVEIILHFYNRCDEVWTVNESTADVLRDYGFKKEVIVMPNGTDLWYPSEEQKQRAAQQLQIHSPYTLLFVGQHNFKKNIRHILEAIAICAKQRDDFTMVFVGQGPDAEKIRELVIRLGLIDRVIFAGQIMDRELLMGVYAKADLLVFPSLYDNAPMVVREAAAAGTPSLVVRGACAAEGITDGDNGFLCEDEPEDIARCINEALKSAAEVGVRARQTIPLAWSSVTKLALKRYKDLVDKYHSEPEARPPWRA